MTARCYFVLFYVFTFKIILSFIYVCESSCGPVPMGSDTLRGQRQRFKMELELLGYWEPPDMGVGQ